MNKVGGRKFALSVFGILAIMGLALMKADATAYGSIAIIVGAYSGANSFIEGRYAKPGP